MMETLLIFGHGYTGAAIARAARAAGFAPVVTSRRPSGHPDVVAFAEAADWIACAHALVSTAPPEGHGSEAVDPVLAAFGTVIRDAPHLRWAGYLSTTGVYGDRAGGWVDEDTQAAPGQVRSERRLAAEAAWRALPCAVDIFRVAGIYGPGRSALDDVRAGRARRIEKPGHAFGRIHRDDIAGAVLAAARQRRSGARVLNLSDDLPASQAEVVAEAARLLGVAPPPLTPFDEVVGGMSEMGRSFWAENRKVSGEKTQRWLGRRWTYPTYRDGLAAILAQSGDRPAQQVEVGLA